MDLKIEIDKNAIEQSLVKAITESAIGERIESVINAVMRQQSYGDGFIERAIRSAVEDHVRNAVNEAVQAKGEQIKAQIAAMVTEDALADFVKRSWERSSR